MNSNFLHSAPFIANTFIIFNEVIAEYFICTFVWVCSEWLFGVTQVST